MILNQTEAAKYVGVIRQTLISWERKGLLSRVSTKRPGAWYDTADLDSFLPANAHFVRKAPDEDGVTACSSS